MRKLSNILKTAIVAASVATFAYPVSAKTEIDISPMVFKDHDFSDKEMQCLVENIYHESRGEGIMGMIAVAYVTLNRVESKRFPNTICGVARQGVYKDGQPVKNKCQFSWWCDGKSDKMHEKDILDTVKGVALDVVMTYDELPDPTNGALFYHTTAVNPYWAKHFTKVAQIGDHIYYDGVRK